jgi:hypothetical protein
LGILMLNGITANRTVTVKVPNGATGYGTSPTNTTADNWGNGFRGAGWDGSTTGSGYINTYITLKIEYGP